MNPREEILTLFLSAFEAWSVQRNFDRAIELADQVVHAASTMGDDETAQRAAASAALLQGLCVLHATPGPKQRSGST